MGSPGSEKFPAPFVERGNLGLKVSGLRMIVA